MHDGHEQLTDFVQFETFAGQLVEQITECVQIQLVVVGFGTRNLHLLLELGERTGVRRLVLLEELEHLPDPLTVELLTDVVQVV